MISVSVLMAVHINDNHLFFDQALTSLYPFKNDLESIVLVADGPLTADLDLIIRCHRQALKIKIIKLKHSVGLGEALNIGVKNTFSEFILRMDSDDLSRPNRLKKLYDYSKKNPSCDVIGSFISEFEENKNSPKYTRVVPLTHENVIRKMKYRCAMNHVSCLIRRQAIIDSGGYEGGAGFAEDWWLWVKMAKKNFKFGNVNEVLVDVRIGNGFAARRRGLKLFRNDLKLVQKMIKIDFINYYHASLILMSKLVQRFSPTIILLFFYSLLRKR